MTEEQTIFRGSPSLFTRFGQLFLAFLLLAAGIAAIVLTKKIWIWAFVGLVLIYLLGIIVAVKSVHYEVTTQRIRFRRGIMSKRTDELECYRVKDTSLIETFPARLFGLGTIEILTFDASTPVQRIEAVHGASALREKLRAHVEECRDRKGVRVTEFDQGQQQAS
jgi:uncharacterized membrane protein YdbT with pleckstrin-like domain